MKKTSIFIIYIIFFLIECNNLQSQDNYKELIITEIKCPYVVKSGSQKRYLYIESNIKDLEYLSTIDSKLTPSSKGLGSGLYKIELKSNGKQKIFVTKKNLYKAKTIVIESAMADGECKGYKIEEKFQRVKE